MNPKGLTSQPLTPVQRIRGSDPEQGGLSVVQEGRGEPPRDLTEQRGLLRACGQRACCGGGHWGRSQVAPRARARAGARVRV